MSPFYRQHFLRILIKITTHTCVNTLRQDSLINHNPLSTLRNSQVIWQEQSAAFPTAGVLSLSPTRMMRPSEDSRPTFTSLSSFPCKHWWHSINRNSLFGTWFTPWQLSPAKTRRASSAAHVFPGPPGNLMPKRLQGKSWALPGDRVQAGPTGKSSQSFRMSTWGSLAGRTRTDRSPPLSDNVQKEKRHSSAHPPSLPLPPQKEHQNRSSW